MIRRIALLVVLTLIAPAVAGALCDITCVNTHPKAHQAAGQKCHGQPGVQGPSVKDVAKQFCHDTGDGPSAALTAVSIQHAAPLAALFELPQLTPDACFAVGLATSASWHPPDLLLVTTQLRI